MTDHTDTTPTTGSNGDPALDGDHRDDAAREGVQRPAMEPQEAFLALGRLDLSSMPLGKVLQRVAELAVATIPGADEISVTLVDGEKARSVAFTGTLASQLDERQYAKGFGPCMDAALTGQTVSLPDLEHEEHYPDFAAVALRSGVRSSLSVGMPVPQRQVGGLNVYAKAPHAFDDAAVDMAKAFADYAAVALLNASLLESRDALARQLEQAMASRAVIEQAKGILMARTGCSSDEAFKMLSKQSQRTNRKLHDVAASVVKDPKGTRRK